MNLRRSNSPAHPRLALVLALIAGAVSAAAAVDPYSMRASAVGAGADVVARNSCFAIAGTVGQPLAGTSSGGGYALRSGFRPAQRGATDSVFFAGFETC